MSFDPFASAATFVGAASATTRKYVKAADEWAVENPKKAAVVGIGLGLATGMLFNKALAIRGAAAVAGNLYSMGKGGLMGYGYAELKPKMAEHADTLKREMGDMATTAREVAGEMAGALNEAAENGEKLVRHVGRTIKRTVRDIANDLQ